MKELFSKTAEFICEFEGFREYAYKDSAGIWTVGYGQTYFNDGRKVLQFDKISKNESLLFVKKLVEKIYYSIVKKINRKLSDNQYISIISFVYNVGETAFSRSTLLKYINMNKERNLIEKAFLMYVNANGKFIKGLENRRKKEIALYFQEKNGNLF